MSPVRKSALLIALIACLTALAVQPGDLGSIDTTRRLQTTHSFWTSAPQVKPGDYPTFGLVGRNGRIYSWYGLGQSILMMPSDMLITTAIRLVPALGRHQGLREVFVSYTVSTAICIGAILLCFRFLVLLGFAVEHAIAGALTLLFATTFLHYTQNMMENNLMLLLTLAGFCFEYEWVKTGSTKPLVVGAAALGANLLVRLTTGLDLMAVTLFVGLCLYFESGVTPRTTRRLIQYVSFAFPVYALFGLIDRGYHFYRFGTFAGTYIGIFARQFRLMHPGVAPGFPFGNPFWTGFLGALVSPEKSIFLFDPMLIVTVIVAIVMWRRLTFPARALLVSATALLFAYMSFHAKISYELILPAYQKGWAGDVSWGDRYISTPVQLLAMISVPLLLQSWVMLKGFVRGTAITIGALSVAIQIASTIFWCPLEFCQEMTLPKPVFVVGLRFVNILAAIRGKSKAWGLSNYLTVQSAHSTIPYFYPIWALKESAIPHSAGLLLVGIWVAIIVTLIGLLFRIYAVCRSMPERVLCFGDTRRFNVGTGESI
jgi:hypothetical protein